MIMQVHDELVFEIPEKNATADVENIIKIMSGLQIQNFHQMVSKYFTQGRGLI